jgi:hypothetical protein
MPPYPERILDPLLLGNFDISSHRRLKNPHEYLNKIVRQELLEDTKRSLQKVKENLRNESKSQAKAAREYKKHFMVTYDDLWQNMIERGEWLNTIVKKIKYENDTIFLNCPDKDDEATDEAIKESDLFIASGFL